MSEGAVRNLIPRLIEPRKFARQRVDLVGDIPVDAFDRLLGVVEEIEQLQAQVSFDISDDGQSCIAGKVDAKVKLPCQRCMETCTLSLDVDLNLAVVWDEEGAKQLPSSYEPWITEEEDADLYSILEEELLLAVPVVAYHDYDCVDKALFSTMSAEEAASEAEEQKKNNPFQVLQQLKGSE